jgi:hypothetical protein
MTGGIDILVGQWDRKPFKVKGFDLVIDKIYCSDCYFELDIPDDEIYDFQSYLELPEKVISLNHAKLRAKIKNLIEATR